MFIFAIILFLAYSQKPRTAQTDTYSVGVPNTMTLSVEQNTAGGKTLTMNLKNSPSQNPIISIQEVSGGVSALEKQRQVFETLGDNAAQIDVEGIPATKYTRVTMLPKENLYETVILFQKGNSVYQVILNYSGITKNTEFENNFNQVVSSLNLH